MRRHARPLTTIGVTLTLVSACSGLDSDSDSSPSASESPSISSQSSSLPGSVTQAESADSPAAADVVSNPPAKSWQDALATARQQFTGTVATIELEAREGGRLEYKIELVSSDTTYVVQFDANVLATISQKREGLGDDAAEKLRETFDPESVIPPEKAAGTARGQRSGAITEWKIEYDDGRLPYEFDIRPDGAYDDVEVNVDAKTGEVIPDS